jgi:hypothetical protein
MDPGARHSFRNLIDERCPINAGHTVDKPRDHAHLICLQLPNELDFNTCSPDVIDRTRLVTNLLGIILANHPSSGVSSRSNNLGRMRLCDNDKVNWILRPQFDVLLNRSHSLTDRPNRQVH